MQYTLPLMPRRRNSPLNTMNNQGDKAAQKEREKSPENKIIDIEICDLSDNKFGMVLRKNSMRFKTTHINNFRN